MITTLLFDLDGTLFDTKQTNMAAYAQAFKEAGVNFDKVKYVQSFGLRFQEMMDTVAPETTDEERAQIKNLKRVYYEQNLRLVQPNHGLLELLSSFKNKYKLALVTTASKQNVTSLLAHFFVDEGLFDTIITGEDVTHGKPNPECYITAMSFLNVQPQECGIFEDSSVGIEAAEKAGAQVIKVSI